MAIAKPKGPIGQRVDELQDCMIRAFPDARFKVTRAPETRKGFAIWTYTSADWDDVSNLVIDREVELMDEGIFIYVIPMPLDAYED